MGDEAVGVGFADSDVRRIVDTAVNPFCVIDDTGTVLWAGESVAEVLGRSASELVGTSMLDHLAPESVEHAVQSLAAAGEYVAARAGSAGWEGLGPVVRLVRADGSTASCSVAVATPVRTGLTGFVLQLRRADAAYALENALIAMGQGRALPEVLTEVAAMLEGELPAAEVAVFRRPDPGGALEAIVGPPALASLMDGQELAGTAWRAALDVPGTVVEQPVDDLPSPLRGIAGALGHRWLCAYAVPGTGDAAVPAGVVAIWSRHAFPMHVFTHERVRRAGSLVALVIQWERGQRALQWAASHDSLTGLHNRSFFVEQVEGTDSSAAAVLYLDLDDFKPVNDRHGHSVGDRVLGEVAARLRRGIRPSDVVARLGGDEFAVLCRGLDDLSTAERLASRLVADVARPIVVDGHEVEVGLSVGLAALQPGDGPEDALDRADGALRLAKVAGKRRWERAAAARLSG